MADIPLEQLFSIQSYPSDDKVAELYQTSEKFIRFLFNELPSDRFVTFVDQVLKGTDPKSALLSVYGDQLKDWETFQRRYARFTK